MSDHDRRPSEPDHPDEQPSEEEIWLDLVARLEETGPADPGEPMVPDETTPPRPATGPPPPPAPAPETHREQQPDRQQDRGHLGGPRDYSPPEDENDDDFEPEEPPSLAGAEPLLVLAWLGAVGGPLFLLLAAFVWRSAPLLLILGVVAAFVASAAYLIMRLPKHRDEHDDGAVV